MPLFSRKSRPALDSVNISASFEVHDYDTVNAKNLSKLSRAAYEGQLDKLNSALKKGDVNSNDKEHRTALHYAAAQGHMPCVLRLLENGAKQAPDTDGKAPMYRAVERHHTTIATTLMQAGSDVDEVAKDGRSVLHVAASNGDIDIVKALLEFRARGSPTDQNNSTPLHSAVLGRHAAIVTLLCQHGADVNIQDTRGRTPVMMAASLGGTASLQALLSAHPDLNLKDNEGWLAIDHAQSNSHAAATALLQPSSLAQTTTPFGTSPSPEPLPAYGEASAMFTPAQLPAAAVAAATRDVQARQAGPSAAMPALDAVPDDGEDSDDGSVLSHLRSNADDADNDSFNFSDDDSVAAAPSAIPAHSQAMMAAVEWASHTRLPLQSDDSFEVPSDNDHLSPSPIETAVLTTRPPLANSPEASSSTRMFSPNQSAGGFDMDWDDDLGFGAPVATLPRLAETDEVSTAQEVPVSGSDDDDASEPIMPVTGNMMAELDDTGSSSFSDASLRDSSLSPRPGAAPSTRRLSEDAVGRKLRQDEAELEAEAESLQAQVASQSTPAATLASKISNSSETAAQPSTANSRVTQAVEAARRRKESKRSASVLVRAEAGSYLVEDGVTEPVYPNLWEGQKMHLGAVPQAQAQTAVEEPDEATSKQQLVVARAQVNQLQTELASLRAQQQSDSERVVHEVTQLSSQSLEDQQTILGLQHQLTTSNALRQELEEQLEQRTEANPGGSDGLDESERLRLQAKVNELEDEVEMLRNPTPRATPTVDEESNKKLNELKAKLKASTKARQEETQAAMREISELSQQAMDAEQSIADLQQQLLEADQQREALQKQVDGKSTAVSAETGSQLQREVDALRANVNQLQTQLENQDQEARSAAANHVEARDALTAQLVDRVEEIQSLKEELNHYQDEQDESLATLNAEANNEAVNTNQLVEDHDEELHALTAELQAALQQSEQDAIVQRTAMAEQHRLALTEQSQQHQQTVAQLEALVQSTRQQAEQAQSAQAERSAGQSREDVERQLARERQQSQQVRVVLEQRVAQLEAALVQLQEAEATVRQQAQDDAAQYRIAHAKLETSHSQVQRELALAHQERERAIAQATSAANDLAATRTLHADRSLGGTFNRTRSQPGSPSASAERALTAEVAELKTALATAQAAEANIRHQLVQSKASAADNEHTTRVAQRQLAALQAERRTPSPIDDNGAWRASTTRLDADNADLLQAEIDNLEEQLAALRIRYERLSKRLVAEEFSRIELDEDVADLRRCNDSLEADVARLTGELEGREHTVATLQGQARQQQQHIIELNDLLQGGETSFSTTRENILIKDEVDSLRLINLELEGQLDHKTALLAQSEASLQAIHREVAAAEAAMARSQQERAELQHHAQALDRAKSAAETQVQVLTQELAAERQRQQDKQRSLNDNLRNMATELQQSETTNAQLRSTTDQLKARLNQAEANRQHDSLAAESKQAEIMHLNEKLRLLERTVSGERQVSSELALSTTRCRELEELSTRLQADLNHAAEQRQQVELNLVKLQSALDHATADAMRLTGERDAAQQDIAVVQARLEVANEETMRLQHDFLKIDAELSQERKTHQAVTVRLEESEVSLARVQATVAKERATRSEEQQRMHGQVDDTRAALQKELLAKTEVIASLKARYDDAQAIMTQNQTTHAQTQADLHATLDVNQQLQARVEELKADVARHIQTQRQHEQQIGALNNDHGTVTLQTRALDRAKDALATELQALTTERDRLLMSLQAAQQEVAVARERLLDEQELHQRTQNQLQVVSEAASQRQDLLTQAETQLQMQMERLRDHQGRNLASTDALHHVEQQRNDAEQLLSEVQAQYTASRTRLAQLEQSNAQLADKAGEMRRLWESEVSNRNAIGAKMLTLEDDKATWTKQLQRERSRVAKALSKKAESDERLRRSLSKHENLQHRLGQLEAENRSLADKVALFNNGQVRSPVHEAEVNRLKQELVTMAQQQREHEHGRVAQLTKAQQLVESEQARNGSLNRHVSQLEEQMQGLRSHLDTEFLHHTEVERLVDASKQTQAVQLSSKLSEINQALENDAAVRDAIDKHRRLNFEETVEQLRRQLSQARTRAEFIE